MTATSTAEGRRAAASMSPGGRTAVAVLRVLLGVLMIAAILAQFGVSLAYWRRIGLRDLGGRAVDFFSAFTHDVNLLGGAIMLLGGVLLLRRARAEPGWYALLRLALLASILVAGIVYNLLLRAAPVPAGSQLDWANECMHVVAPAAVLLEWIVGPRVPRLPFRAALVVVVFPVLWLAYTFVRGPLVADELTGRTYFYPYGFLDPNGPGGWPAVLTLVAELMVFAVVLGLLAVLVQRLRDRLATGRPR